MPFLPLDVEHIAPLHSFVDNDEVPLSKSTKEGMDRVQRPQTAHRINIINAWGGKAFFEECNVLEIGCGQGDMSAVLAAAVSPESENALELSIRKEEGYARGSVVAWDPAPGSYGSPATLEMAQSNLRGRAQLAPYLTFSLNTPLSSVLSSSYTHAVLAHSLYYFESPAAVLNTFKSLAAHDPPIKYLCLAEYGLRASTLEQVPHLLAVMAQSALESVRPPFAPDTADADFANVRTVLSPESILALASEAGWSPAPGSQSQYIIPEPELQDGGWEVGTVLSDGWIMDAEAVLSGERYERQRASIRAMQSATKSAAEGIKALGQRLRTMDVWCAVLSR